MTRHGARPAYTLMEIIVALAIAMLLLGGLYAAFTVVIGQTTAGRDVVSETEEIRGVLTKMSDDLAGHLAPLDTRNVRLPKSFFERPQAEVTDPATEEEGTADTSSTTNSSTGDTSNTTNSSTTQSGTNSSSSSSSSSDEKTEESEEALNDYAFFNLGVIGDAQHLTLFVGKVPDYRVAQKTGEAPILMGDLRRICYWVVQGPEGGLGLARHEAKIATSAEAMNFLPYDRPDVEQFIIAEKVVGVTFEYFDGTTWTDTWDGSQFGADGKTPYGPPMAIVVNLQVRRNAPLADGTFEMKYYRHVIALPTANGVPTTPPEEMLTEP